MLTIEINTHAVELYDDIKLLPASQHQKACRYQVMDAELPGSEAELDAALVKLQMYHRAGQTESFDEQLNNIRLGRRLILSEYDPKQLEWACYLATIDGVTITDYSEANLEKLVATLNPTQADIEEILSHLKKNLIAT